MQSLFDKYGGFATFNQLTRLFYQKLLDSPQVAHYFSGVDIPTLAEHQTNFLATALGGPTIYQGADLKTAHAGLMITNEDFTEVAELLEECLEELGVEPPDINTIINIVAEFKEQIVSG
ncbi:MAG: group 1 truncated hemoglobin [Algicola sp.]|nr:group 1 truncated hemoglobin [Algicola sp.]